MISPADPHPPRSSLSRQPASPELREAQVLARWLDSAFTIPGTNLRIGLDPIIGLIPGIGDLVTGLFSGYVILLAMRAGASRAIVLRMLLNLGIDLLVGAVPVVGDLFDFGWKANTRNVALLQQHAQQPVATARASRKIVALVGAGIVLMVVGLVALLAWFFHLLLPGTT